MADLPAGRQARKSQKIMYYVYVLQSLKTGKFYKGLTSNLNRRIDQHNKSRSPTTKKILPVRPVYVHECNSRTEARAWEKFFKSGIGREIIKELAAVVEW